MFGGADVRRLLVLVGHLPKESMLIQVNSEFDELGRISAIHLPGFDAAPAVKADRTVTSLAGVNMRELYGR